MTGTASPFARTLSDLERQKADVLGDVGGWSPERRTYRPSPSSWSAVEVLDHLVRVEREILIAARQGLDAPHRRGIRDRLTVAMLDWLFRSDRRVRAPASVPAILPSTHADLASVSHEWNQVRGDVREFLTVLPSDRLDCGIFKHPVAGWMSMPQVLRFFWVHTHHHRFQLARLATAARSQ